MHMAPCLPAHTNRRHTFVRQLWATQGVRVRSKSRARKRRGGARGVGAPMGCVSHRTRLACTGFRRGQPVDQLAVLLLAVMRISSFTTSYLSGVTSARREGNPPRFASNRTNRRVNGVRACSRAVWGRCVPSGSTQPQHGRSLQQPFSHKQPIARGARATKGLAGARTSRIVGPVIRLYVT